MFVFILYSLNSFILYQYKVNDACFFLSITRIDLNLVLDLNLYAETCGRYFAEIVSFVMQLIRLFYLLQYFALLRRLLTI